MDFPKKVLLLEVGGAHSETLYTQVCFLKSAGYLVTLATDERLAAEVAPFKNVDAFWKVSVGDGFWKDFKALLRFRRQVVEAGITKVIFNTAQSKTVQQLCLLLPRRVGLYGTLHNLTKIKSSFGQKIISRRLGGYFLLARYLVEKAAQRPAGEGLSFEWYYPMFFPPVETGVPPANHFWKIVVPGAVEESRRDYKGIIKAFAALPQRLALKFLFLGNAFHAQGNGPELQKLVQELGVEEHFRFWNGFVDTPVFHREVALSDAVMLGIHPHTPDYEDYTERQISGSWNLAFAYQKPLLMPSGFEGYADFKQGCLFYEPAALSAFLLQLPQLIAALPTKPFDGPDWDFKEMARRYIAFLER